MSTSTHTRSLADQANSIELDTDCPVNMRWQMHESGRVYIVEIVHNTYTNVIRVTGDVDIALDLFSAAVAVGHPVLG